MKIIGIQRNVTFKYDGNSFTGTNIYTSEERPDVEGVVSQKFFFNSSKESYKVIEGLKVNDNIRIYFNRYGKPDSVEKL